MPARQLRARGQRTRRTLLDAGIEVFRAKGYHPARVDDIVKVAKTSHGTFYLYFANKEELFRALALDVASEVQQLAKSLGPFKPDDDGYASLREWLERFAALHERYGPVIRAWTEADIDNSDAGRLGADVIGGFAAALGARLRRVPSVKGDPDVAALALVALIERFNFFVLSGQIETDREAVLDLLTDVTYAALFGPRR